MTTSKVLADEPQKTKSCSDSQLGPSQLDSWRDFISNLYPGALQRTYCVPPLHFNRVPYRRQKVPGSGESALVLLHPLEIHSRKAQNPSGRRQPPAIGGPGLSPNRQPKAHRGLSSHGQSEAQHGHGLSPPRQPKARRGRGLSTSRQSTAHCGHGLSPPRVLWCQTPPDARPERVQDSDFQDDFGQNHVVTCLHALGVKQQEPMFVLSQLNFGNYLNQPAYAAAAAQLPLPRDLDEEREQYSRKEADIIVFHRRYGVLVGELKSIGRWHLLERRETPDDCVDVKIEKAVEQLARSERVIKYLVSDIASGLTVKKTLFLPYISSEHLQRVLTSRPKTLAGLCHSIGASSVTEAVDLCVCADQLSDPDTYWDVDQAVLGKLSAWWRRRMADVDPHLCGCGDDQLYLSIVSRFVGPATTVTVHCPVPPRVEVRTLGQAVAELGHRLSRLVLTPQQVDLLTRDPPRVYLSGPPGTGKTTLLVLQALRWLRQGHDVHVVSLRWGALAANCLIAHQLQATLDAEIVQGTTDTHQTESAKRTAHTHQTRPATKTAHAQSVADTDKAAGTTQTTDAKTCANSRQINDCRKTAGAKGTSQAAKETADANRTRKAKRTGAIDRTTEAKGTADPTKILNVNESERPKRVQFHCYFLSKNADSLKKALDDLKESQSEGTLCVVMDELKVDGLTEGRASQRLVQELCQSRAVDKLKLWAAGLCHREMTGCLQVEPITTAVRHAPSIHRELSPAFLRVADAPAYSDSGLPAPGDGPAPIRLLHAGEGHTGDWPVDCEACGHSVAATLKQLGVGPAGQGPLAWRDVFVITRSKHVQDEVRDAAGGLTSRQACGVVRGLRSAGVPVCVLWQELLERDVSRGREVLEDLATAATDRVAVVESGRVQGLERRVVVWLLGWRRGFDDLEENRGRVDTLDRVYIVSRCVTQLVIVDVPESVRRLFNTTMTHTRITLHAMDDIYSRWVSQLEKLRGRWSRDGGSARGEGMLPWGREARPDPVRHSDPSTIGCRSAGVPTSAFLEPDVPRREMTELSHNTDKLNDNNDATTGRLSAEAR